MAYACIDVGSNTTRLLVAEVREGRLRGLAAERAFTRIGKALAGDGRIPGAKVAEAAEVVAAQASAARGLGAERIVVVATAAIREAPNSGELAWAVEERARLPVWILTDEEEARLSFLGAIGTHPAPPEGDVAVVDVGGGSTEVAVGSARGGVSWWRSLRIGSGLLADRCLRSDPPGAEELAAVRRQVGAALEGLDAPRPGTALAVGGSATSLRRLAGAELGREALERALGALAGAPAAELARRLELDPERVRLLPAGILVLEGLSERLGAPLAIGNGGLREGVLLDLAGAG